MPSFLKSKRNLFALGCILFILLTICIIAAFFILRSQQNSNVDKTQEIIKQLPPISAPENNTSKSPITLKYPEQFTKAIYEDEGCGHQAGLVTYTYTADPSIRVGQLVISNKNLPMNNEQKKDFQDAVDVINGTKTVVYSPTPDTNEVSGLPLRATYNFCGGAAYYPAEVFNVNYPGVDKATAIMSLGGFQSYFDDISNADMTLWIYVIKGDELAEISLRFSAGEIFTDTEANSCLTTQDGTTFIDPQCVVDNTKGSASKLSKYKAKAQELINVFELVDKNLD